MRDDQHDVALVRRLFPKMHRVGQTVLFVEMPLRHAEAVLDLQGHAARFFRHVKVSAVSVPMPYARTDGLFVFVEECKAAILRRNGPFPVHQPHGNIGGPVDARGAAVCGSGACFTVPVCQPNRVVAESFPIQRAAVVQKQLALLRICARCGKKQRQAKKNRQKSGKQSTHTVSSAYSENR